MQTLLTLKTLLIIVIAIAASTGASTIYFQLRASDLNDQLAKSNKQVSDLTNQTSRLQSSNLQLRNTNTELSTQIQIMQSRLDALTSQIATLSTKITLLTSHPPTNSTVIGKGTITVDFNGISYIPFTIATTSYLNLSYTVASTDSYFPASAALYLLNPTQYSQFKSGNYTSSTWSIPYAASITTSHSPTLTTGQWYLAFQEEDPNGGYPANVAYIITAVQ